MSFVLNKNYLTAQEAESLISFLQTLFSPKSERAVARFGITRSYASDKRSSIIPEPLNWLVRKIQDSGFVEEIGHVTVNRYLAGQTIPYHIDNSEAGDMITIVSLGSDCKLLFKNNKDYKEFDVPANSLIQFMDDLRWKYKHSVSDITETRYSIVFRKQ